MRDFFDRALAWARDNPTLTSLFGGGLLAYLGRGLWEAIFFDALRDGLFAVVGRWLGIADVNNAAAILSAIIPWGLGAGIIYAAFRLGRTSSPPSPGLHSSPPDWPIRELFFYLDPDVLDRNNFERIGRVILDALSEGRLRAWGRPLPPDSDGFPVNAKVQSSPTVIKKSYWPHAAWTYQFFADSQRFNPHTHAAKGTPIKKGRPFIPYADIRVSKASAQSVSWPTIATALPERLTVVQLFAEAEKRGWLFVGTGTTVLRFIDTIRQAARLNKLTFFGVPIRGRTSDEINRPVERIPAVHCTITTLSTGHASTWTQTTEQSRGLSGIIAKREQRSFRTRSDSETCTSTRLKRCSGLWIAGTSN